MRPMEHLTVNEVIDALGGTAKAAELFDVTPPAVSNWRAEGKFPERLHYRVFKECKARGIQYDPAQQAA